MREIFQSKKISYFLIVWVKKRIRVNSKNRSKIILSGICALKKQQKDIEIEGREKRSFEDFLRGQQSRNIKLDKVLGIGGEGVVIQEQLEISLIEGMALKRDDLKAENIRLKSKEKKKVAVKFVKFEKSSGENFEGQGLVIKSLSKNYYNF